MWRYVDCKGFDGFAFTFEIPQIGREFDLLKVTETKAINIELKSQMTTPDKLKKQFVQNRHLGFIQVRVRNKYFRTYRSFGKFSVVFIASKNKDK